MRHLPLMFIFVFFLPSSLRAQSGASREFSLSGTMGSADQSGSSSASGKFVSAAVRVGFLISGPLELEPELQWTMRSGDFPSYSVTGNLSYNLILAKRAGLVLFPLVGYGPARGVPPGVSGSPDSASSNLKLSLLNVGVGMKLVLTNEIGLRAEFRHQQYAGTLPSTSAAYKRTYDGIFFGFSVFF